MALPPAAGRGDGRPGGRAARHRRPPPRRVIVGLLESPATRAIVLGRIRSAASHPDAADARPRDGHARRRPARAALTDDEPETRAVLVGAQRRRARARAPRRAGRAARVDGPPRRWSTTSRPRSSTTSSSRSGAHRSRRPRPRRNSGRAPRGRERLPGAARSNSVIEDRSFIASTAPKISTAVRPFSSVRTRAHSWSRGPRTGWARYARASSSEEIA